MLLKQTFALAAILTLGGTAANGSIAYTCDPNVATSTCAYLNTTVAGLYSSTFTDANASIYIKYGTTGLASTSAYLNAVPYADYLAALQANPTKDALQFSSLASLTNATSAYGSGNVGITIALAQALGISGDALNGGLVGTTASGAACTPGTSGCYNAVITVTNDSGTPLYYDNLGGTEPADAYDYYATVEHETDEVLGTSSCIGTQSGGVLTDGCDFFGGTGTPSAVDLYRYNSAGNLAINANYLGLGSAPAGAYFSFDGGVTNGANGKGGSPKFYNTLANGDDYADFVASSPDCGTNQAVQDATGCPGEDKGLSLFNDGKGEINILNAVGYDLQPTATPEPATIALFGIGLGGLAVYRRRRRA
jgi:hypothetical protein